MRRALALFVYCAALSACVTTRPVPHGASWDQRFAELQRQGGWQMNGRVAVAVGTEGWQASLTWHEQGPNADVHLAGPFGVGAVVLHKSPAGVTLDGAPSGTDVIAQLQERLGFDLPLDRLRYWLLGAPDPDVAYELKRNDQDRVQQLTQTGWVLHYEQYIAVQGDVLPARVVLQRDDVRVRIAVDRWDLAP